jgi:hypothetical protein
VLIVAEKYLAIYLNDHLAAATGALQLARRAASANRGSGYGETLADLAAEIADDCTTLQNVLRRLDVRADQLKILASFGAERLGRLKLNGELLRYSPLSRLEEIEILSLGVAGKLRLWRTLATTLTGDPRVDDVDFDRLIERATSQRRRLDRLHRRAAEEAL